MKNEKWKMMYGKYALTPFPLRLRSMLGLPTTANSIAKPLLKVGSFLPDIWQFPAIDTLFIEV